jgi:hypothetical protein
MVQGTAQGDKSKAVGDFQLLEQISRGRRYDSARGLTVSIHDIRVVLGQKPTLDQIGSTSRRKA